MASDDGWAKAPDYRDRPRLHAELRAATAADRARYLESGFSPVSCADCGNRVLVRKNSRQHTSVQWTSEAAASCPQFAAVARQGNTAHVESCAKLRASIERAALDGVLEVPDPDG